MSISKLKLEQMCREILNQAGEIQMIIEYMEPLQTVVINGQTHLRRVATIVAPGEGYRDMSNYRDDYDDMVWLAWLYDDDALKPWRYQQLVNVRFRASLTDNDVTVLSITPVHEEGKEGTYILDGSNGNLYDAWCITSLK